MTTKTENTEDIAFYTVVYFKVPDGVDAHDFMRLLQALPKNDLLFQATDYNIQGIWEIQ